ncbi:MAG TPA: HAD family phosphatase [Anaeromyxobacteraceae bacterium]|nr:HAD family phosphatase [Anaeromyxobacteraceae bacterium]
MIERKRQGPIDAVIFDLDATLVDSEDNYYLADVELLRRRGIPFSLEDKKKYIGGGNLDMMVDLVRRFGLSDAPEALAEEKNAIYLELALRHTPLYPPMKRFWDLVRARGLPVAVASGSSPAVLRAVLDKVGLAAEADAIVSAEDVARGKPAPDVFLEAARRLGVPAPRCAVVEDSRHGVEAARRAEMPCIAVPYLTDKPLPEAFASAALLFEDGMATFDPDRALAWLVSGRE